MAYFEELINSEYFKDIQEKIYKPTFHMENLPDGKTALDPLENFIVEGYILLNYDYLAKGIPLIPAYWSEEENTYKMFLWKGEPVQILTQDQLEIFQDKYFIYCYYFQSDEKTYKIAARSLIFQNGKYLIRRKERDKYNIEIDNKPQPKKEKSPTLKYINTGEFFLACRSYKKYDPDGDNLKNKAFELLSKYINANIPLIPCGLWYDEEKKILTPYQLKYSEKKGDVVKIKTLEELTIFQQAGIKRFLFKPADANLSILDLDRHKGKPDGIKEFYNILEQANLKISIFSDIDNNSYPVYCKTPNNGIHLYFKKFNFEKCSNVMKDTQSIDIRNGNNAVMAGGSIKNGKIYNLIGDIEQASYLPYALQKKFIAKAEKPKSNFKRFSHLYKQSDKTAEELIQELRANQPELAGHNFILGAGYKLKMNGYNEQQILSLLENTPEHLSRRDQKDTITCIKSLFK